MASACYNNNCASFSFSAQKLPTPKHGRGVSTVVHVTALENRHTSADKAMEVERLWEQLFSNPAEWWDNRAGKNHRKVPDFRHKVSKEGLWVDCELNPSWVPSKLASFYRDKHQGSSCKGVDEHTPERESLSRPYYSSGCSQNTDRIPRSESRSARSQEELRDEVTTLPNGRAFGVENSSRTGSQDNLVLKNLCRDGRLKEAIAALQRMHQQDRMPSVEAYSHVLQGCMKMKALAEGKQLHDLIVKVDLELNSIIGPSVVNMFIECGSLSDAAHVFNSLSQRTTSSYMAIILGYVKCGAELKALNMYQRMVQEGVEPNRSIFVSLLKACGNSSNLELGKKIHADVNRSRCAADVFVGTALVCMYAKCGRMMDARRVFSTSYKRDVACWNAMIAGYAQQAQNEQALQIYFQMQRDGVIPNLRTYVSVLKACGGLASTGPHDQVVKLDCLQKGKQIHSEVVRRGFATNIFVATTLISMYANCGSTLDACSVFDTLPQRDAVIWNTMIGCFIQEDQSEEALQLFGKMKDAGVPASSRTYVNVLRACGSLGIKEDGIATHGTLVKPDSLQRGRELHAEIVEAGCALDANIGSSLIDMYAKCGSMTDAQQVFETLPETNVAAWTGMITGYRQQKDINRALQLYAKMLEKGIVPNNRTFVTVLKACSSLAAVEEELVIDGERVKPKSLAKGQEIHEEIVRRGYASDTVVGNILAAMYANCGCMKSAQQVFDALCHRDVGSWNAMIIGYAHQDRGEQALQLYSKMQNEGVMPDSWTFVNLLTACGTMGALEGATAVDGVYVKAQCLRKVMEIHKEASGAGFETNAFVGATLIDRYATCGSMMDAQQVFDRFPQRSVVAWTAIIGGYAQQAQGDTALHLFYRMQEEGVKPNNRTFACAVKACSSLADLEESTVVNGAHVKIKSLRKGERLYTYILNSLDQFDTVVGNALVDMFVKCGSMDRAEQVFETMPARNVGTWTAMVAGYAQQELNLKALQLYSRMQDEGVQPNHRTIVFALKACGALAAKEGATNVCGELMKLDCLQQGRRIHADSINAGCESDAFVGATLVDMYSNCGSLVEARHVFDRMTDRGVVAWTAMIAGYAQRAQGEKALQLYQQMRDEGVKPNSRTFVCTLKACVNLAEVGESMPVEGELPIERALRMGKEIHSDINERGLEMDPFVSASLVQMYASCGRMLEAQRVFDALPSRDVAMWTAMIAGYAQQGKGEKAILLYERMGKEGVPPDTWTLVSALKACCRLAGKDQASVVDEQCIKTVCLQKGKELHEEVIRRGFGLDLFVGASLVSMYASCGSMEDAQRVFDSLQQHDVVLWTAMIGGYAHCGEGERALQLYTQMQEEGHRPNNRTFVSLLKACGSLAVKEQATLVNGRSMKLGSLDKGRAIHAEIVETGVELDMFVATTLVDMYAKCGSMVDAHRAFDSLTTRDVVSWTAMIAGYADLEQGERAVELYRQMQEEGVRPSQATYLSTLQACSCAGALEICSEIHQDLIHSGLGTNARLATSLINAYAKCGSMVDAQHVFDTFRQQSSGQHDVCSWTALIAGYARQGSGLLSLECLNQMQQAGIRPDGVTALSVLAACSHAGLVDEGLEYFESLSKHDTTTLTVDHYTCLVDLLGRAGLFNKLEQLLLLMPMQPNIALWLCLLGACQKHNNLELGRRAFEEALLLDPAQSAPYLLMSNIYGRAGMWEQARKIDYQRRAAGAWKQPGLSWVEHGGQVHTFGANDTQNTETPKVLARLKELDEGINRQVQVGG